MATPKFEELQKLAADLQISVDEKQLAISDKIAADDKTIADLQAIIDAGTGNATSDEQLQGVIDSLTASKSDLEATVTA